MWHLVYVAPRLKHISHGMFLNMGAMWHLTYLGLHICHVAPMCRHMPRATFRPRSPRLGLDLGHVAHRLGLDLSYVASTKNNIFIF
jgi:hypothetical protein